tara:strand:- start:1364 stop:1606 length:243 start_codon:yes stop_codon:yes gene_type:complete
MKIDKRKPPQPYVVDQWARQHRDCLVRIEIQAQEIVGLKTKLAHAEINEKIALLRLNSVEEIIKDIPALAPLEKLVKSDP